MCHFAHVTMKRTILWSTGSAIAAFQACATMKRKDFRFEVKTARKTKSKSGKEGYQGTKELKGTQLPSSILQLWKIR